MLRVMLEVQGSLGDGFQKPLKNPETEPLKKGRPTSNREPAQELLRVTQLSLKHPGVSSGWLLGL